MQPSMRAQVLSTYRSVLRTARALPSHNHRGVALLRARTDFRSHASLAPNSAEAVEALQLAQTQLDNLQHQLSHMRSIMGQTTLTHDAPKPARLYEASAAARGSGVRAYSTARRVLAEPAVAAAEPAAAATPAWMSSGAAAASAAPAAVAAPALPTVATHIIHVRLTPNNTICTLTTSAGRVVAWTSSGSVGFKNAKKSTYMACIACGEQLALKARQQNIRAVDLHIAGFHKNKRAVLKGVVKGGLGVVAIRDTTPIPFNGCKPRKMRRL